MATENVIDGNTLTCTYWSLDEYADAAARYVDTGPGRNAMSLRHGWTTPDANATDDVFEHCLNLARNGWSDQLDETLRIAEDAVEMAFKEHEVKDFTPVWDVTGSQVDVARYLSGEPENMIDFPALEVSKVGKVVTLVAGGFYSAAVSADALVRRGQVLTAFALALTRLGHSVELWVDVATTGRSGGTKAHMKVLVKGTNDTLDPAKILFAYAHPGMFRALGFAAAHNWPAKFRKSQGIGSYYTSIASVAKDFPEGTIYLPGLVSAWDMPDAHEQLRELLREIGLLAE